MAIGDYEAVAGAFMRALERRLSKGKPIHNVASVASFFLSRIDVLVDQILRQCRQSGGTPGEVFHLERLLGQIAIANAKLAYQRFQQLFSSERWQILAAHGARVQRPLWASTSTKDPSYRDVMYVETLIAPNTVNTISFIISGHVAPRLAILYILGRAQVSYCTEEE